MYRPYYYDRLSAGVNEDGRPSAWVHRIVGPAIFARFHPPTFKDGIDPDGVDGAAQLLYDIPAIRVEFVRHEEPVLNTGFWRGVGVTHNNFVIESVIDELAAAAKQDPVAYRRALLGKAPRAQSVLDVAAQAAGWGRPLPSGWGRGVSILYSEWGSYLAEVAEVEVSKVGEIRVHRVVCAVDFGTIVAKFWIHISREEQLKRFEERQASGYKSWKLTDEDWRNREKWGAYEDAVEEMLLKTSTRTAPWTLVEGNDKYWARTRVLGRLVEVLSKALDYKPGDPIERGAAKRRKG